MLLEIVVSGLLRDLMDAQPVGDGRTGNM